jgi:hypothetical protein
MGSWNVAGGTWKARGGKHHGETPAENRVGEENNLRPENEKALETPVASLHGTRWTSRPNWSKRGPEVSKLMSAHAPFSSHSPPLQAPTSAHQLQSLLHWLPAVSERHHGTLTPVQLLAVFANCLGEPCLTCSRLQGFCIAHCTKHHRLHIRGDEVTAFSTNNNSLIKGRKALSYFLSPSTIYSCRDTVPSKNVSGPRTGFISLSTPHAYKPIRRKSIYCLYDPAW